MNDELKEFSNKLAKRAREAARKLALSEVNNAVKELEENYDREEEKRKEIEKISESEEIKNEMLNNLIKEIEMVSDKIEKVIYLIKRTNWGFRVLDNYFFHFYVKDGKLSRVEIMTINEGYVMQSLILVYNFDEDITISSTYSRPIETAEFLFDMSETFFAAELNKAIRGLPANK